MQSLIKERKGHVEFIQGLEKRAAETDEKLALLQNDHAIMKFKIDSQLDRLIEAGKAFDVIKTNREINMLKNESMKLKSHIKEQSDRLANMEQNLCDSDDKQQVLKNRISQLEKENTNLRQNIDRQKGRINQLGEEVSLEKHFVKESSIVKLKIKLEGMEKEVSNLKTFAEQTSRLQISLCDWENVEMCHLLLQKLYEENKYVIKWHDFVKDISKDAENFDKDCVYLQNVVEVVEDYNNNFVYPDEYCSRLEVLARSLEVGISREEYLKVNSSESFNKISVTAYYRIEDFEKGITSKGVQWHLQSSVVATHYNEKEECLYVALNLPFERDGYIYALNALYDGHSVEIPLNGRIESLHSDLFTTDNCIIFDFLGTEARLD